MRKSAGFTIVELLIVIAIAGVLSAIAIPNFSTWVASYRLKSAAQAVHANLIGAKMLGAKEGREYRITTAASAFTIQQGNLSSNSTAWTTVKTLAMTEYPGVTANAANAIVFVPRGTASNETITLTNSKGATKTITVSIAGRVKIN